MATRIVLVAAAALHFLFAAGELFPANPPFILGKVLKELNDGREGDERLLVKPDGEQKFVATIVQNAGIYNLIMAAGFVWAAFPRLSGDALNTQSTKAIRIFFCGGAVLAGLFGITLSYATLAQAAVGIVGILCVLSSQNKE